MGPGCDLLKGIPTGTKVVILIRQIAVLTDDPDLETAHEITLAQACIQDRCLYPRIGAND